MAILELHGKLHLVVQLARKTLGIIASVLEGLVGLHYCFTQLKLVAMQRDKGVQG